MPPKRRKKTPLRKTEEPKTPGRTANTIEIPRPTTNSRIQLTVVPKFPSEDSRSKIPRVPKGGEGIYHVTYFLSVPGRNAFREHLDFSAISMSGESLLKAPGDVSAIKVKITNNQESAEIIFTTDSRGFLATARMVINAQGFRDAERYAFDLIAPQLSYWSFVYDVALDVSGFEIVEERTESRRYSVGVAGRAKVAGDLTSFSSLPEYRRFLAAYREAMNATSVFYQALSFYKVAEGINAHRKRKARACKSLLPSYPNEQIPNDAASVESDELWLESLQPYLGRDFNSVLGELRETIRNAIAHLSQLDDVLDSDRYSDMSTCLRAVAVLKVITKTMLQNEIRAVMAS